MIKRQIIDSIKIWLGEKKILILKGPRQVGKTTIMKELQLYLLEQNNQILSFSADQELGNELFLDPKKMISFIQSQLQPNKKLYIFIDEFQYITQAGIFLKVIFDEIGDKIQIIISGSSSLEITKNSEYLTGRKIEFIITGITFFEYLSYQSKFYYKQYLLDELFDIGFDSSDIKKYLLEYLQRGYYPEVLISHIDKKQLIQKDIIQTYITKDISGFLKIESISGFNNLLKILAYQISGLCNKSEISNTLNIDHRKIDYYFDILEGTYIISSLRPYFTNIRKELSKTPKIYFNNIGTRNYFTNTIIDSYETIDGGLIENFVFVTLQQLLGGNDLINFYRTISKSEIDFIIQQGNNLIPIEVKYTSKNQSMSVAIRNFTENYSVRGPRIMITKDTLKKDGLDYYIPLYLLPLLKL